MILLGEILDFRENPVYVNTIRIMVTMYVCWDGLETATSRSCCGCMCVHVSGGTWCCDSADMVCAAAVVSRSTCSDLTRQVKIGLAAGPAGEKHRREIVFVVGILLRLNSS